MTDCLIVDDEADICELIEITLTKMGITSKSAGSLYEARKLLDREKFRLCLTDMKLPDGNGIDLIRFIDERFAQMPVAMITAHGNMEAAIDALKSGAFDFVQKPVDLSILRNLVDTALKIPEKMQATTSGLPPKTATSNEPVLLGSSDVMQTIRHTISKLARNQAPVHISGESGTGKEIAARMIHYQGPRAAQPFVAINCGAIPQELMESEFFGHIKGSFTGAVIDKTGLFQEAHKGTLFLDEIADLPLHMQVKLLRAIQEKKIRPVGSSREIPLDVRIISATHKNLLGQVESGQFRQDLFYRINVLDIYLPALREHSEDLEEIARFILRKICTQNQCELPEITTDALEKLIKHGFPGNVRELENILEGTLAMLEHDVIEAGDLKIHKRTQAHHETFDNEAGLENQL